MRDGSVLMEFIVVAPLYFVLLGGLFILGDLVVNRIRIHMGDHFVTWVAGSRFCPVDESGDKDSEKVRALLKPLYDLSIGGSPDDVGFKVDYYEGDTTSASNTRLNHFMGFYMGRIKRLSLKIPNWATGMFAMQEVMTSSADANRYSTINYQSDECFRSYSFHRLPLTGIDKNEASSSRDGYSRSRDVSSDELVHDGYISRVVSDYWISDPGYGNGTASENAPAVSKKLGTIPRILGYFGE